MKQEKIGSWIGTEGEKKLIAKIDSNFTPYEFWGNDNQLPVRNFWEPGRWTYADAAYFGVYPAWLNSEGKVLHTAVLKEAVKPEESDKD